MSEHTPGPWTTATSDITPMLHNYVMSRQRKGKRHVSYMVAACGETPEGEANARLIAAAPELLDIARRGASRGHAIDCRAYLDNVASVGCFACDATAAIRKATVELEPR